ncbi:MAG: hypothetical protein UMV23_04615 [Halanaerobium sp.]|nr:hypothetical protein [Halanaerobium sp.]
MEDFGRLAIYIVLGLVYLFFRGFSSKFKSFMPPGEEKWKDFAHPALSEDDEDAAESAETPPLMEEPREARQAPKTVREKKLQLEEAEQAGERGRYRGRDRRSSYSKRRSAVSGKDRVLADEEGLQPLQYWNTVRIGDVWEAAEEEARPFLENRQDLVRGIILSEVLGPPRSRRPFKPVYRRFYTPEE